MTTIYDVQAWEALDSRGTPTVACEVRLSGGARGQAIVPSGASTGAHEARELRDGGARYGGRGVLNAVRNVVEVLGPAVAGHDAADQASVDARLRETDGTNDCGRLGANALLAVSVATALAHAEATGRSLWQCLTGEPVLPLPMVNIVSGGAHAGRALDIQDVLVVPLGAKNFAQAIEWAWRVRRATAELAVSNGLEAGLVADEGGLGPRLSANAEALELVTAGIHDAGLRPGYDAGIAVDVAATQFHHNGRYVLDLDGREFSSKEFVDELVSWCDQYPVVSIEDPLAEDDWAGWGLAYQRLGARLQIVGDDLFVTDTARIEQGIAAGAANALLVKPNQVGTLSDAFAAVECAREAGYATVVSARSGETEDAWLADLAVGWGPGQVKVGSTTRSERNAKWNRLLRIEADLGTDARFVGPTVLAGSRSAPH